MFVYTRLSNTARISVLILPIILLGSLNLQAKNAPATTEKLSGLLPDSVSLNGKVVYVDFWASWCVPCRHSFPWMEQLYDTYHNQGLEIVAVSVDKDHQAALQFLRENRASFPVIFDSTGSLAKEYGLDAMPTSFIYNREGQLVTQHRGFVNEEADSLDSTILELLKGGKSK